MFSTQIWPGDVEKQVTCIHGNEFEPKKEKIGDFCPWPALDCALATNRDILENHKVFSNESRSSQPSLKLELLHLVLNFGNILAAIYINFVKPGKFYQTFVIY